MSTVGNIKSEGLEDPQDLSPDSSISRTWASHDRADPQVGGM